MAGFFGLFNYEKEGPGVRKDAPKKKTVVVFFEVFFGNFWRLVPINLFYLLLSLPILTGGLASAGITRVTRSLARRKHSFGISDFLDTVRKNWKQALGLGILRLFAFSVLGFSFWFYVFRTEGVLGTLGAGVSLFLIFVFSVMDFYAFTLLITFRFTVKQILGNSFRFVFLNLWRNLLCAVVLLLTGALFTVIPFLYPHPLLIFFAAVLYVCAFPGFRYMLVQFCTFPSIKKFIIDPYYKEHPGEDTELRRDLGLETEEPDDGAADEDDPDAPVFKD